MPSSTGAETGAFMGLAAGGEAFVRSPDGGAWTVRTIDPRGYGYGRFTALAGTPDKLVIVGFDGDIRLSP